MIFLFSETKLLNLLQVLRTAASLFFGILMDKKGNFITRTIAYVFLLLGLIMMAFIDSEELLLWGAWPLLSIAGFVNHFVNLQMPRTTPAVQTSAMALISGT